MEVWDGVQSCFKTGVSKESEEARAEGIFWRV